MTTPPPTDAVATDDAASDEILRARARAGTALRDLGHAFIGRHATLSQIHQLTEALDDITSQLWPRPERTRADHPFSERFDDGFPQGRFDHGYDDRPVSGTASPWGLDLEMHRFGDEIEALVTLRAAHEGAPGRSHGGVVAALFDDVFGFILGVIGEPAFTGELSVRYLAPVPIGEPLACRVRLERRDGRKLHMTGELTAVATGDVVTTATALFIAVEPDWLATQRLAATAARPAPSDEATDHATSPAT